MMYVFAGAIEFIDAVVAEVLDAGIEAFVNAMFLPVWLALCAYLFFRGYQAMTGNLPAATTDILREAIGLIFAVCLATNLSLFNAMVRDFFFYGVPQFLGGIAARISTPQGGAVQPGTMAEQLTVMWAQVWKAVGHAWNSAGGWQDWPIYVGALVTLGVAAIALILVVLVYMVSHFFLALVIMIGPVFMALGMFRATRGYVDRYFGKVASLILLQVMAVLVMAFVTRANLTFMDGVNSAEAQTAAARTAADIARQNAQRGNFGNRGGAGGFYNDPAAQAQAIPTNPNGAPQGDVLQRLQVLFGIIAMFLLGGAAMIFLPYIAYSLGSGLMVNVTPNSARLPLPGRPGGGAEPAPSSMPSLGVSLNQGGGGIPQPAPPSYASLAPPPPTPLGATP